MAKGFSRLTRPAMRQLASNNKISEHGITFERCANGDGVFTINVMVDGQRIHRVIGRESDGTTRTQAEEFIEQSRQDAKHGRLALGTGRKKEVVFAEAARRYLEYLADTAGKDVVEKQRRLALHLVPFFGTTPLSKIDSVTIELYKKQRCDEPSLRGGVRRGSNGTVRLAANADKLTSRATINRELAVLSHLLNKAVEWGWINSRPTKMPRFQVCIPTEGDRGFRRMMTAESDDVGQ